MYFQMGPNKSYRCYTLGEKGNVSKLLSDILQISFLNKIYLFELNFVDLVSPLQR